MHIAKMLRVNVGLERLSLRKVCVVLLCAGLC